ncbi:CdaR family transcriptional regulator [Skermania sp. ID1734]|uniref:PucR family transcriptional regulator n=1 Tax=Skermania sp. ID1734 TaxID=2597516 RepID=UPI00163DDC74|nr:helix-turn-helix domain-containing protein [Skermania sp. ID1734]
MPRIDTVPEVARKMLAGRDAFIGELFAVIRAEIKALNFDDATIKLLQASVAENVTAAVTFLERNIPVEELEAPRPAIIHARALAQHDIPLSALVRAYRIGHTRFLDATMRYAVELAQPDSANTLIELVNRCGAFIDKVVEQVGRAYEQERDRWMSSRGGFRQKWVGQILDGSITDVRDAENALRYRFDAIHVAVEVWPDADVPTREAMNLFDEAALVIAHYLRAIGAPLLVPSGERQARIWFRLPVATPIDAAGVAGALTHKSVRARLAIGQPERGIEGFRRTLTQATRVQQIAVQAGGGFPRATTYHEIAPLALMAHDIDALGRFVGRTLGVLANDDNRNEWLRETLRVFLSNNRSFSATAQQMHLHRNTIQYRIQQAIECCGVDLDDGAAVLELQIALFAARWLRSSVLRNAEDVESRAMGDLRASSG